jgi:hypothetical protein
MAGRLQHAARGRHTARQFILNDPVTHLMWSRPMPLLFNCAIYTRCQLSSTEHWWNDTDRGKPRYWEKNLSQCLLHSTNLTWTDLA